MIYRKFIGIFCIYFFFDQRGGREFGLLGRSNELGYMLFLIREKMQQVLLYLQVDGVWLDIKNIFFRFSFLNIYYVSEKEKK